MRRRAVGPYQIVERRDQFEVRKGRTILSTHDKYFDAEDDATEKQLSSARPARQNSFTTSASLTSLRSSLASPDYAAS
jgi:hypothetical protein